MTPIQLEILKFSYWEHFKKAKDLALIYPPEHPERLLLQKEIDKMLSTINEHEKR
jgi:hypothetical protein